MKKLLIVACLFYSILLTAAEINTQKLTVTTTFANDKTGNINITVKTGGELWIDGEKNGDLLDLMTAFIEQVAIGEHSLELRYSDGTTESRTVQVDFDKTVEVAFDREIKETIENTIVQEPFFALTKAELAYLSRLQLRGIHPADTLSMKAAMRRNINTGASLLASGIITGILGIIFVPVGFTYEADPGTTREKEHTTSLGLISVGFCCLSIGGVLAAFSSIPYAHAGMIRSIYRKTTKGQELTFWNRTSVESGYDYKKEQLCMAVSYKF